MRLLSTGGGSEANACREQNTFSSVDTAGPGRVQMIEGLDNATVTNRLTTVMGRTVFNADGKLVNATKKDVSRDGDSAVTALGVDASLDSRPSRMSPTMALSAHGAEVTTNSSKLMSVTWSSLTVCAFSSEPNRARRTAGGRAQNVDFDALHRADKNDMNMGSRILAKAVGVRASLVNKLSITANGISFNVAGFVERNPRREFSAESDMAPSAHGDEDKIAVSATMYFGGRALSSDGTFNSAFNRSATTLAGTIHMNDGDI